MQAGKLNQRVKIWQPVEEQQDSGEMKIVRWTLFKTVWAAVSPVSSREYWSSPQLQATVSHRVRLRYVAGITVKMRFEHAGRYLNIAAPPRNTDERNRELTIDCIEAT